MTDQPEDAVCEVVITAPDAAWLAEFTRRLVDDHLAAAGHVLPEILSIYRWQGEVYDKAEARVALHTRRALLDRIIERTDAEHPYEVPCVIATEFSGSPAYVDWVRAETVAP